MHMLALARNRPECYSRLLELPFPSDSSHLLYAIEASLNIHLLSSFRSITRPHIIINAGHLEGRAETGDFLSSTPDIPSADDDIVIFMGVVRSDNGDEGTVVVRTMSGFDRICSLERCSGLGRVHVGQLVQIHHHVGGEFAGETFVECAAGASTPVSIMAPAGGSPYPSPSSSRPPSLLPSRPPSVLPSRPPSLLPSRPPSPAEG